MSPLKKRSGKGSLKRKKLDWFRDSIYCRVTTPNWSEKNRWQEDLYNFSADGSMSFKASIKSLLVAINISPENTVCSKILSVVAQSLEFDNDNCFYDALDFLTATIPSVPYCIFCTQEYSCMFYTEDLARRIIIAVTWRPKSTPLPTSCTT